MSKILDDLIACGVPSDTILAVAKLIADAEAAEKIRAQTRIRVRNHRERVTLRNVSVTLPPLPPSSLKEKSPPTPPSKENTLFPPSPRRAQQMPADFALTEADCNFAKQRGWDATRIASEFEHFCDHAKAKGRTLKDWHAGWRTWVQSPYNLGKANGNGRPQRKTTSEMCDELAANLRAKMAGADDAGRGGNGGQADAVGLSGNEHGLFDGVASDAGANAVRISEGGSNGGLFTYSRGPGRA
jgi:hypothetical protein